MWSSGAPQADYGTSLKLDSCSEKSPPSLVKSTLDTRHLATEACVYMYLYVCVCICMCVYVFVFACMYLCGCSDDQCKGLQREPLWLTRSGRVVIVLYLSFTLFLSECVLVLCRVCAHRFEGYVYFLVFVFLLIFSLYLYSSPGVRAADQKCEGLCPKRSKIETLVAPCSAWPGLAWPS